MELRPGDLIKEWKAGKFRPFYYFVGEELSAKSEALAALRELFKADDFNKCEFAGNSEDEAARAISEAMTLPVFADKRLILVTSPKLLAGAKAAFAEYLKDPLKSTTLVLLSEDKKPDPKDPLVKAALALNGLCVFSPLSDEQAESRLRAKAKESGKELSEEAAAMLVGEAGTDWGILRQELEKLVLFCGERPAIGGSDALQCLGYQRAADPFALGKLVADRRLKDSLEHLRRLLRDTKADDVAFRTLAQVSGALLRQLKAKRMLRAKMPPDAIFRTLRLHPYWDKDFLAKLSKIPEPRILRDLKRCLETEVSLKSKAWLDPKIEIERLVADLCR